MLVSEVPQTIRFSDIRNMGEEVNLGVGTVIALDAPEEIDSFANLITGGLQEELRQHDYPQYKGDVFKSHGKSLSELLLSSRKAQKFTKYPFRGHFSNFRISLLPPDLSFILNSEGIIPETAITFSAHAEAQDRASTVVGEISRTYTLYVRYRINGPQKEKAPYLMVSSGDSHTEKLEKFMGIQQQEWSNRWKRVISQGIQHPFSGGLMSLGKKS